MPTVSGTPNALTLGLAAGHEVAVPSRRALANPELQAPAAAGVRLTSVLAARHPEQVNFTTWQSLERLGGRALTPLPDVPRADLLAKASMDAAGAARAASHLTLRLSKAATQPRLPFTLARAICHLAAGRLIAPRSGTWGTRVGQLARPGIPVTRLAPRGHTTRRDRPS